MLNRCILMFSYSKPFRYNNNCWPWIWRIVWSVEFEFLAIRQVNDCSMDQNFVTVFSDYLAVLGGWFLLTFLALSYKVKCSGINWLINDCHQFSYPSVVVHYCWNTHFLLIYLCRQRMLNLYTHHTKLILLNATYLKVLTRLTFGENRLLLLTF
jgi:hypothetical protein